MEPSDIISLGAFAISVAALAVSLYEATSNRPRVKSSAGYGAVGGAGGGRLFLIVSVSNSGKQPTTIQKITLKSDNEGFEIFLLPNELATPLPHVLDVGRAADFLFALDRTIEDPNGTGLDRPLQELTQRGPFTIKVHDAWRKKPLAVKVR